MDFGHWLLNRRSHRIFGIRRLQWLLKEEVCSFNTLERAKYRSTVYMNENEHKTFYTSYNNNEFLSFRLAGGITQSVERLGYCLDD